ncbi:MAG: ribonuclease E activity regulator RraA, partial [Myxococcaceae bacterium]
MAFSTADLSDANPTVTICEPGLRNYGGITRFCGQVATVKAPEDNTFVRKALEEPGKGRVLVVEGGASRTCAFLGDQLGALAQQNGWAGVLVHG